MLFIGDLNKQRNSYKFFRALREIGHEVTGVSTTPSSDSGFDASPHTRLDGLLYRIGYPLDKAATNKQVLNYIRKGNQPSFVWIFKAAVLRPRTVGFIKRYSPNSKIIFFSYDNHLKQRNNTRTIKKNISLAHIVFVIRRGADDEALYQQRMGAKRVEFFDFGYDKNTIIPSDKPHEFDYDVLFIGTYEEARARDLVFLANNGIEVTVFGGMWDKAPRWVKDSSLRIQYKIIRGKEFVDALHRSKIALNFLRKANDDTSTTRTFEIPAAGTFMLSERSWAHEQYFIEDEEAVFFDTQEDLLQKAIYFLQNDGERQKIALSGLRRCQTSGYDFHSQLEKMLQLAHTVQP